MNTTKLQAIYDSVEDAQKDGWITISEARRQLTDTQYKIEDTSGNNSLGYAYTIFRSYNEELDGKLSWENCRGKPLIGSDVISFPFFNRGSNSDSYKFREMFSERELKQLINNKGALK